MLLVHDTLVCFQIAQTLYTARSYLCSNSLRLLLGPEAPVMTPNGVEFSLSYFFFSHDNQAALQHC